MITQKFINAVKEMIKHRPKWSKRKRIIVLSGRETLVEYSPAEGILKIKIKRCTGCGECCLNLVPNSTVDIHWGTDSEGKCKKLYKDGDMWRCNAKFDQPYRCFPDPSVNTPECEMEFHIEKI